MGGHHRQQLVLSQPGRDVTDQAPPCRTLMLQRLAQLFVFDDQSKDLVLGARVVVAGRSQPLLDHAIALRDHQPNFTRISRAANS